MAIHEFGVGFLDMRAVKQQDFSQIKRRVGTKDRAAKAFARQSWQITGMIKVGMSQDNGIDTARINRKRGPVALTQILKPLEQTTINQHPPPVRFEQVARAGHGASRTQK